jgi:hypothetical protein
LYLVGGNDFHQIARHDGRFGLGEGKRRGTSKKDYSKKCFHILSIKNEQAIELRGEEQGDLSVW